MARNGSGVYSLPAGYLATTGQTATAAQHNDPLEDLQTDMNTARPIVAGGTGATTASGARTALGLEIGTNVQAYDATLTSVAALGTAANKGAYTTGVDTWAEFDLTAAGRALLDDADAAAQRTTLGLSNISDSGINSVVIGASTPAAATVTTLDADTITDGTDSVATGYVVNGSAKAWATADMTTPALRDSFNVASLTDNGTGRAQYNFTNAMTDGEYGFAVSVGMTSVNIRSITGQSPSASSVGSIAGGDSGSASDYSHNSAQVWGDLA